MKPHKPMSIPQGVKHLYDAFTAAGHQLYIAGGAVRDFVLGKQPKDYDLATDATPDEVKNILDRAKIPRTDQVGEQFGVVIAKLDGEDYEIATFRVDMEAGRQTQVKFIRDPRADAQRRDLTMNALFYDIGNHKIIDFVGGVDDIQNGRVKTVGDPMERFGEDPLRVLRLIRFHCRFNPSPSGIDDETQKAIVTFVQNGLVDKLNRTVPSERVRDEFVKGLKSAQVPVTFLRMYYSFDILKRFLLPGFKRYNTNFINTRDPNLAIASILKYNPIDTNFEQALKSALVENADVDKVLYYINMLNLKRDTKFFGKFHSPNLATVDSAVATLVSLIKKKPNATDEEIEHWAKWFHIPLEIVRKFRNYEYRKRVSDIPGAEDLPQNRILGDYMKGYNAWKALRAIGKMPGFKEWCEATSNLTFFGD